MIVRRKAAGTIRVTRDGPLGALGLGADKGISALLALAEIARTGAAAHDPAGPDRLTVVPTILRSGDALNVVPAAGELVFDIRADRLEALRDVLEPDPAESRGARGSKRRCSANGRGWTRARATARSWRAPLSDWAARSSPAQRGGASDASHFAAAGIAVTIDGLGPRGGHAHAPEEFVDLNSLLPGPGRARCRRRRSAARRARNQRGGDRYSPAESVTSRVPGRQ